MVSNLNNYINKLNELKETKLNLITKSDINLLCDIITSLEKCNSPQDIYVFLLENGSSKFFDRLKFDSEDHSELGQFKYSVSMAITEYFKEKVDKLIKNLDFNTFQQVYMRSTNETVKILVGEARALSEKYKNEHEISALLTFYTKALVLKQEIKTVYYTGKYEGAVKDFDELMQASFPPQMEHIESFKEEYRQALMAMKTALREFESLEPYMASVSVEIADNLLALRDRLYGLASRNRSLMSSCSHDKQETRAPQGPTESDINFLKDIFASLEQRKTLQEVYDFLLKNGSLRFFELLKFASQDNSEPGKIKPTVSMEIIETEYFKAAVVKLIENLGLHKFQHTDFIHPKNENVTDLIDEATALSEEYKNKHKIFELLACYTRGLVLKQKIRTVYYTLNYEKVVENLTQRSRYEEHKETLQAMKTELDKFAALEPHEAAVEVNITNILYDYWQQLKGFASTRNSYRRSVLKKTIEESNGETIDPPTLSDSLFTEWSKAETTQGDKERKEKKVSFSSSQ